MTKNSFSHPIDEVHFGAYVAQDVAPILAAHEALAHERLQAVVALPAAERTYENTVLAYTRATDEFDAVVTIVGILESGLGGEWNDPYEAAVQQSSKLHNAISMNRELFDALQTYAQQAHHLPANRQKLLDEVLRHYKRDGITLPKVQQEKLAALRLRAQEVSTAFEQNVVKASDAAGLYMATKAELEGLDDDVIAEAAAAAKKAGKTGFWISFNEPNYVKVMSQCVHATTRQAFHEVANTRGAAVNAPLAEELLQLRSQIATLLGYITYADYVLEERMAKDGATAQAFIADLTRRYKPKAQEEYESLLEFAREYEKNPELTLSVSDVDSGLHFYYAAKQAATISGVDERSLKAYFPLPAVLEGMFQTLTQLYGVTFTPSSVKGWHEDVTAYDIHDEQGQHIARVWCDWFARQGKKGGAWMNNYYTDPRPHDVATSKPHLGLVSANLDAPTADRPSLLTLRDVETVWHEFGHFMHFALGTAELPEQSMSGCLWDFIEAPSQIMENWVWQPEIIQSMARHYQTGEVLSTETMQAVIAGRTFRVASAAMRQLYFATVDLQLHTVFTPGTDTILDFSRTIKQQFVPVQIAPYEASIATFSHIFAGGYAAAYYSYKWAEAIEADLFSRFQKEGVLNATTGRAYARDVLAPGDEQEPAALIEQFLGRPADSAAMLRRDGIEA